MACKVLQFHPTEDRIVIDTGCKIFDRQCTYLAQGNHWGNCQFSSYVRPVSETECNGRTVPTGELFDFDITAFKEMPPHVRSAIRAMNQTVVVSARSDTTLAPIVRVAKSFTATLWPTLAIV